MIDFYLINVAEQPPTISITSSVQIAWPSNNTDRNYILPITITGATSTVVVISQDGVVTNVSYGYKTVFSYF